MRGSGGVRRLAFGAVWACVAGCGRPAERAPADTASRESATAPASVGATAVTRPAALDTRDVRDTLAAFIARERLTTLARECYAFEDAPEDPPYSFAVREKHDGRCGGDPNTAPRLFNIQWDAAGGRVITDARGLAAGRVDTLAGPRFVAPR